MSEKRRYGFPKTLKLEEDETKCVQSVRPKDAVFGYHEQCKRKRGHGKDGLYCVQHARFHPRED